MRPPICAVCRKRFAPSEGGKIYFKVSEDDKVYKEKLKEPGFTGHPPNLEWFCGKHLAKAKEYSDLYRIEALKIIKSIFEDTESE